MTQQISTAMHFTVDPATAYAMVTDPAYARVRAERTYGRDVEIEVSGEPARVVSRRTLPVPDELPSFARGMVGDGIRVEETHAWGEAQPDGSRRAELSVLFPSLPVKVVGTMALDVTPDGCTVTIEATVNSSMPMVGSVIEQGVKSSVLGATKAEQEIGREWLNTGG